MEAAGAAADNPDAATMLRRFCTVAAMAQPPTYSEAGTLAYYGEVWTDGRGYATVNLPVDAALLEPPLAYELHDLDPTSSARVTAELRRGRFTIRTDEPHVKVAWRITGRPGPGDQPDRQQEERT
jgi:hypothetical protein